MEMVPNEFFLTVHFPERMGLCQPSDIPSNILFRTHERKPHINVFILHARRIPEL